jgi:hypothetical protein
MTKSKTATRPPRAVPTPDPRRPSAADLRAAFRELGAAYDASPVPKLTSTREFLASIAKSASEPFLPCYVSDRPEHAIRFAAALDAVMQAASDWMSLSGDDPEGAAAALLSVAQRISVTRRLR